MRIVSVSSGKVLLSIATEKTIASSRSGADIFKFLDMGTKLLESETGYSVNEPVNYAVRAAIEAGVVQLVYEGESKGLWKFKDFTYKGSLPAPRPLPLSKALDKWPDSMLYCDKTDLCYPRDTKDQKGKIGLEEERRLAHVGITRAEKYCVISFASNRRIFNQWQNTIPSRFINELSEENIEILESQNAFQSYSDGWNRTNEKDQILNHNNYNSPGWKRMSSNIQKKNFSLIFLWCWLWN